MFTTTPRGAVWFYPGRGKNMTTKAPRRLKTDGRSDGTARSTSYTHTGHFLALSAIFLSIGELFATLSPVIPMVVFTASLVCYLLDMLREPHGLVGITTQAVRG